MKRVTIKKSAVKDKDLIELFNQMTGVSAPDPLIIIPKYEKMLMIMNNILKIMRLITKNPFRKLFPREEVGFSDVEKFIDGQEHVIKGFELEEMKEDHEPKNMQEVMANMYKPKYDPKKVCDVYKDMKECDFTNCILVICASLARHKKYIGDKDSLNDKFILETPGPSMQLFKFTKLDFKQIFIDPKCTQVCKNYFLSILHHLLVKSNKIYSLRSSPDIDVDQFSELLVKNIGLVKKQIPRCDKAFNKILNSVDLLKSNFSGYYKNFIQSNNPGIIIEEFVKDVAIGTKSDAATLMQFKRIINYYRKKMGSVKSTNPQIAQMFKMVDSSFAEAEKEVPQDGSLPQEEPEDDLGES